ncbi:hypothetical protein [Paenibacillus sp. MMS18-CY102]|uniref:hypothetical protein n=1 Tax=Paenibacillus sp. MMS18-CY102 TaxID=2682849 RepID=UPI001365805C|nr:hypothetical protein [Paenibacillus sp. MMS18-CY102]MWC29408.1 hypothetical protein [Paenibacillus sp. MMS18-CY102]
MLGAAAEERCCWRYVMQQPKQRTKAEGATHQQQNAAQEGKESKDLFTDAFTACHHLLFAQAEELDRSKSGEKLDPKAHLNGKPLKSIKNRWYSVA